MTAPPAHPTPHDSTRLWLASGSPRRRELLGRLGVTFQIESPDIDETVLAGESPGDTVERLARQKAERVAGAHPGTFALGSDTLVALDGRALGKPRDVAEARAMLAALSGKGHEVWTGVALAYAGRATVVHAERARVVFRSLSAEEIAVYVATGEPMDKAGAYAVQGGAKAFVERLEGDETAVIGLPLGLTRDLLQRAGLL